MQVLEKKLYEYLGVPFGRQDNSAGFAPAGAEFPALGLLRELRLELGELRSEASRIGQIPLHYPSHVVVVMKVISALLPWYTRPILQFAQRTSQTAELTSQLLEKVLKTQESLAAELARLKARNRTPVLEYHGENGHLPGYLLSNEDSYSDQRARLR